MRTFSAIVLLVALVVLAAPVPVCAGWLGTGGGGKAEPNRIVMRGATSAPVKGSIAGDQEAEYVVKLPPGLDLSITVTCKPEKAVVPVLVDESGAKVELRDEGGGCWMGAVPATSNGQEADFQLTLKKAKSGPAAVAYTLEVSVPEAGDDSGGGSAAPVAAAKSGGDTRTVIAPSGISLRVKPDPQAQKLATLPKGTVVEVLSTDGPPDSYEGISAQWFKIRANGQEGWAFGGFIGEAGEALKPEGSGVSGAMMYVEWESGPDHSHFSQMPDPRISSLKLKNDKWLKFERGATSGQWEFNSEGYLFFNGTFITRDIPAGYEGTGPQDTRVLKTGLLTLSPVSPSGRHLFIQAAEGAESSITCIYVVNLDTGFVRSVDAGKYGVDEWVQWSADGKSAVLKTENEGQVFKYKVDLATGKVTDLK